MTHKLGLNQATQLPKAALQVAASVVFLRRTASIRWSTDPADLDRVLNHLRARLEETA